VYELGVLFGLFLEDLQFVLIIVVSWIPRYLCASVGAKHWMGYSSEPVIVVVVTGGFDGMLICATPDGLDVQWKSIHMHFFGLSCPLLLCRILCHF